MGYSYIMHIYEDGIKESKPSKEIEKKLKSEIGEAVIKLCLNPEYDYGAVEDAGKITTEKIGTITNGINLIDEVHSTENKLYLWAGNCLRPIKDLHKKDLKLVEHLINKRESK